MQILMRVSISFEHEGWLVRYSKNLRQSRARQPIVTNLVTNADKALSIHGKSSARTIAKHGIDVIAPLPARSSTWDHRHCRTGIY